MKVLQILLLVGGLCLISLAALCLSAAGYFYFSTSAFVRQALPATAIITGSHSGPTARGSVFYPIFRFTDPGGQEHEVTSKIGRSPPNFSVGQQVDILYPPEHPDEARVNSFLSLWLFPLVFAFAGMVPLVLGIIFLIGAWLAARSMKNQSPSNVPPSA